MVARAAVAALLILAVCRTVSVARAAETPTTTTLKTAAEVLALPVEAARSEIPVSIRGVVTAAEPDWEGKFVVQDSSGGIFVSNIGAQPAIGDLVEIEGVSRPGSFAPVLRANTWKKTGTAALPPAKSVTVERLMAGVEDSQRVEITGLVRAVSLSATRKIQVDVSIGAYRIRVFPKLTPNLDPQSIVAAKVRVRGTVTTSFNAALRQLTAVNLFVPTVADFIVEEPEPHPPFAQSVVPLGDTARYRANASLGERMHVKGTVTFQRIGLDLFIQDGSGGLHIQSQQATRLLPGRPIEAVGFLEFVDYQPILKDAVFRQLSEGTEPVREKTVPISELRDGLHPAELIVLRGTLLERSVRQVQRPNAPFAGFRITCTVQSPELTFIAECEQTQEISRITDVPPGSFVEVRGIGTFETGDDGKLRALTLLLPDSNSMTVLQTPSWFTAERMLIGFAIVCVLLAGVAGWSVTVTKKNAMLGFLIAEREKAQKELQEAHDLLEERVRERTEQLKVEMSVRKTAELEFRAVLVERTRLARELHDTLEQALTGIALQLDTAAKLFQRDPVAAQQHLELARGFLRTSQLELRQSIWNLRSRELEQFDVTEALAISCRQLAAGSEIVVELETNGERKRLPEFVEENLLRIGQEAMTNVVKHAGATRVTIRMTFNADSVSLEIKDNGTGLDAAQIAARGERRFGLLGMSERAKRLGGRLDISSAQGEGTVVRVILPLPASGASPALNATQAGHSS